MLVMVLVMVLKGLCKSTLEVVLVMVLVLKWLWKSTSEVVYELVLMPVLADVVIGVFYINLY